MRTVLVVDPVSVGKMQAVLTTFPTKVARLVIRKALNAWGGVVKRIAVAHVKRGATGLLAKSISVNVVMPEASFYPGLQRGSKPPRVEVGPSRKVSGLATNTSTGRKRITLAKSRKIVAAGGKTVRVRPSRYAHLVEAGIAGTKHIQPSPFIGPAFEAGKTAGLEAMKRQLTNGIYEEAAKLNYRS